MISLEEREADYADTVRQLEAMAATWLEKRAAGPVPRVIDLGLDIAISDVRRAARRRDETRKRVERAA